MDSGWFDDGIVRRRDSRPIRVATSDLTASVVVGKTRAQASAINPQGLLASRVEERGRHLPERIGYPCLLASRVVGEAGAVGVGVNEGDELSSGIINLSGAVDVGVDRSPKPTCRVEGLQKVSWLRAALALLPLLRSAHLILGNILTVAGFQHYRTYLSTDCCWVQFRSVPPYILRTAGAERLGSVLATDGMLGIVYWGFIFWRLRGMAVLRNCKMPKQAR